MAIMILNQRGHNRPGQLQPKPGRLATSSYREHGARRIVGSMDPRANALGERPDEAEHKEIQFGETSRAGTATQFGQNRTETNGSNPLSGNFNVNTIPKRPAYTNGGAKEGYSPVPPSKSVLLMPHERPIIGAHNFRNESKKQPYRTVMGASRTVMPSDTAFHKLPEKVKLKTNARPAHEPGKLPRRVQPSFFRSNANLWYDPNNSFAAGATQTAGNGTGKGRWQTTKRGAAG